jgi:WD40 repeat protein
MPRPSSSPLESAYWCFLSYRHADDRAQDRGWATWLHQEIERYDVPAELVGTRNSRGDVIPERIYPVFRDEVSLPADADLSRSIVQALDRSRVLVVLCSPRAVESRYVAEEVLHFKRTGKADRIVAAILDGEPGDARRECFPAPLRHPLGHDGALDATRAVEPIAADFRLPDGHEGFTSAEAYRLALARDGALDKREAKARADAYALHLQLMKLKVIAGVLGVPLEELRDRDQAYRLELARRRARVLRQWLAVVGTLTVLALAAGVAAFQQRNEARSQELTAINQTLEAALELVTRFWDDGDVPRAMSGLSRAAALARQVANHPQATRQESERGEQFRRRLELTRHGWRVLPEPDGVQDFSWSADGTRVATLSAEGRLRLWDASTGRPIAQASRRLGGARKIRVAEAGGYVFVAGDRRVQEAMPLYVWRWDPETDSIEEVYEQGHTDEGEGAVLRTFEMGPRGDRFAIDFLDLSFLTRAGSGHLEEAHAGGGPVQELAFDAAAGRWLGRIGDSLVAIDPGRGGRSVVWNGGEDGGGPGRSRLLGASGRHYAYHFRTGEGVVEVRWRELGASGDRGAFSLELPGWEGEQGGGRHAFEHALLGMDGAILAVPVVGGPDERMELYETGSGAFAGVFRLPRGRRYDRARLSPTDQTLAVPAPDGLELWSPFLFDPAPAPAEETGTVAPRVDDAGETITLADSEPRRVLGLRQLRGPEADGYVNRISSVLRWPDRNHLLVGYADLSIGLYRIEPFRTLELWAHQVEAGSLDGPDEWNRVTVGPDLHLVASPDGRRFISWSQYGGAQIWDLQQPGSPSRPLGPYPDIVQVLFSPDGGAVWTLYGQGASRLGVALATPQSRMTASASVRVAAASSATGTNSSGAWARRTSPGPKSTVGVPPWLTSRRMSAPYGIPHDRGRCAGNVAAAAQSAP